MPAGEGPALARFGAAILFVAAAFALTLLGPTWLRSIPFMPYFAAVLAASWLGGLGPGLLACALSVPAAVYSAIEPVGQLRITDARAWFGVVGFLIIGALLTLHTYALRKAIRDARAAVALRDDFLSVASHELNTPVAAMRLDVRGLLRAATKPDSERVTRIAHRIDRSAARMATLIDELLDATRVRSGRLDLKLERFDLAALASEVVERFRTDDGPEISFEAANVEGLWDRGRLDQVISNLVANAMKYGDNKPIAIRVADGECATLAVVDHGVGVPDDARERIFQRFERVASSRNYGGFGLGLWIACEIVRAHHGSIRVDNTLGGGATFLVKLPKQGVSS
jgi:signal transduction histidine kinase